MVHRNSRKCPAISGEEPCKKHLINGISAAPKPPSTYKIVMAFPVLGNGWLNLPYSEEAQFSAKPVATRFMRLRILMTGQ